MLSLVPANLHSNGLKTRTQAGNPRISLAELTSALGLKRLTNELKALQMSFVQVHPKPLKTFFPLSFLNL